MKYLKMLGLAAVAAMGLMAFLGASSASADVLCTTNTTPACAKGWGITEVKTSLKKETSAVLSTTAGEELVTCTESSVSGTIEKQGEGIEPEGPISSLSFGGCNHTTTTIANGSLKVETRISLDKEGHEVHTNTVTASGSKVTVAILGITCTYGPGTNPISIGDLTVGAPAVIDVNTVVNKVEGGFLCPSTAKWTATYQVTNHTGVWVAVKQE
jgi:hypothetical protein